MRYGREGWRGTHEDMGPTALLRHAWIDAVRDAAVCSGGGSCAPRMPCGFAFSWAKSADANEMRLRCE